LSLQQMALSLAHLSMGFVQPGVLPTMATQPSSVKMETIADLKVLAKDLNPVVGYWNPLGLGDDHLSLGLGLGFWGNEDASQVIGFLREAEIKHGRIAMAGFVGFCVQSAGLHWPGSLATGLTYEAISAAGGPGAQWDAMPLEGKMQIVGFVGLMELFRESTYALESVGAKHYMRGGKPGYFPSFKAGDVVPHPVPLDLFDPFGLTKNLTPERKAQALLAEVNNGRLAMIGLMGALAATKGCIVPGLDTLGLASYSGEYMAPFEGAW